MKGQPSGELKALEAMCSGQYDIIVLDEVTVALRFGLLTVEALVDLINLKPETVELVITGRYAPRQIVERADLVTEMQEVKHYYQNGVGAREGIEQ
jgi:cob(I)alamin adenosyltransferase